MKETEDRGQKAEVRGRRSEGGGRQQTVRLAVGATRVRLVTPEGRLGMIIARDPLTPGQERCLRELRPYFQEFPDAARKMGVARVFASPNYMHEFDAFTKCSILPIGQDVLFANGGAA